MNEDDVRRNINATFDRAHHAPAPGFEGRMRAALLAVALKRPVHRQPPRLREGLAVLAAVVAAVAVVAALLAPRLLTHVPQPVGIASPSPLVSPTPDPNKCRLPVVVDDEAATAVTITPGFIDVASGQFTADPTVSFADLPHLAPADENALRLLSVYDPMVKRWLPGAIAESPDQRSYAYVHQGSSGSELHLFDLIQHQDRNIWSPAVQISLAGWRGDGIYASTEPWQTNSGRFWRIDPVSGQATEIDAATFDPYYSLIRSSPPPAGSGRGVGISGNDPEHAMYTIGGRNPGTPYAIVVIVDGHPTDIYSGINGDQTDFDPVNVWYDGSRLWFSNYDSKYLWTWTAATGLTHYSVQIPGAPGGYRHSVVYWIAGPCL
jgi:hypothetical protein